MPKMSKGGKAFRKARQIQKPGKVAVFSLGQASGLSQGNTKSKQPVVGRRERGKGCRGKPPDDLGKGGLAMVEPR